MSCQAIKKDGSQCQLKARYGDYCGIHRRTLPNEIITRIIKNVDPDTLGCISSIPELAIHAEREKVMRLYPRAGPILRCIDKIATVAVIPNATALSLMNSMIEAQPITSQIYKIYQANKSVTPSIYVTVIGYINAMERTLPLVNRQRFKNLTRNIVTYCNNLASMFDN
jgi:hypothetical protein